MSKDSLCGCRYMIISRKWISMVMHSQNTRFVENYVWKKYV